MDEQPQGGLLNWFSSPAGQGLLSAVAGYAAGARRGTPVNNIGKGLLAGVTGYSGALEDQRKVQEDQRKLKQQQQLQTLLANPKASFGELAAAGAAPDMLRAFNENQQGPKVHSVVQSVGPDGKPMHIPIDAYGRKIGDGYAGYVKPERPQRPQYLNTNRGIMADDGEGGLSPVTAPDGGVLMPYSASAANGAGGAGGSQKPMPIGALKQIQDNKEALATSENINSMMADNLKAIEGGSLKFGPIQNLSNQALNWAGRSTPESQAYAKSKADFEKMRNDSLRLNKGVQTDGDAQRAWNELFENMNDEAIVAAKMKEIIALNERAIVLRQGMLDEIYSNYGRDGAPQPQQAAPKQFGGGQRSPKMSGQPAAPASGQHPMIQQAKQAIAAGRDPEAVMQMLEQNGIDPSGLIGDSMQGAFGGLFP